MNTKKIKLFEVGLRDGIQNEKTHFNMSDRLFILKKLIQAGVKNIEVGSFVSKKAVPSMKLSSSFIKKIRNEIKIPSSVTLSALVPNEFGYEKALENQLRHVAVMASATESFSQKNTNCSIKENLKRIEKIGKRATQDKVFIRGYLSMSFTCPDEGEVPPRKVFHLAQKLLDKGVQEIVLSDTIGGASPLQIQKVLNLCLKKIPLSRISLHCHNTQGLALPNILTAIWMGVYQFDSSVGGLGGCPYAKGTTGNIATSDLLFFLKKMNKETGINLQKLKSIRDYLKEVKKIKLSPCIF